MKNNLLNTANSGHIESRLTQAMSLAVKCHQAGDLQSAERLYQQVLRISPQHADAWHLLGVVAQQCGYLREAVGLIDQAIQHNNRVAQYHFNRGVCLQELGETQKAIAGYQTAVRLKPAYPEAYDNLGVALQDCDRLDEAIEAHRKALSYNPESLLAHNNLGTLLQKTGETDKALAHFRQALDLHPAEPGTRMKLAVAQLAKGNLSVGWREYEWRHYSSDFRTNNAIRIRPYAKWDGSDLSECTVLAYSEQGIGDEVMFAGCLQELATLANHCLLECDPRLVRLFARSFPEVSVLAREPGLGWNSKRPPPIDWSIPTGSLPRFFRNAPNDFPSRDCYLLADPDLEEKWRHKLAALPGNIKIGISWQGGIDPRAQCARSIPLDLWQGLFAVEDTCFVNLQYGDHRSEIEHFQGISPRQLVSFAELDPLKELDNFCALISVLDLVISIDNSTVHFAGALGTPTWALLPALADWRWMEKRTDSPWYRSVRLFRQKEPGPASRSAVLAEVEAG
jgi:Flp pilus assembly protein TadD